MKKGGIPQFDDLIVGDKNDLKTSGEKGDNYYGGANLFCGDDGGQGCAVQVKTNLKVIEIWTNDWLQSHKMSTILVTTTTTNT
jgi:hypothetical protein